MKNLLATVLLLLLPLFVTAQSGYPRIEVEPSGDTVVVMTLEQAQQLDNASDLLALFEKMDADIADYDYACIKVINEQGQVITSMSREILNLKEQCKVKDEKVDTLQSNIDAYMAKELLWKKEVENVNKIADEYKDELGRSKWRNIIGGSSAGIIIVGLITALILK
jgi:hypothetical protein